MPVYKDTARGTWFAKFQHKDWNGETKTKVKRGFKTKKEALEYERQYKVLKEGRNEELMIKDLASLYLADAKKRLKPSSYYVKQGIVGTTILPVFGDIRAVDLTAAMVRNWQTDALLKLSPNTQKQYINILSSIIDFGVDYYGIRENPVKRVKGRSKSKKKKKEIHFWTLEQYKQFRETVRKPVQLLMYDLLYWSGLRIGELLALPFRNVDFEKNTIKVTQTLYLGNIQTPKTETSLREISMPTELMQTFKAWIDTFYDKHPDALVFECSPTRGTLLRNLHRGAKEKGLPDLVLHDLRHSHASFLINNDMPILLISERLGHENPSITLDVYSHLFPNRREVLIARLNEFF